MAYDATKIKPGWSFSKLTRYLPEAGGCPRRFAHLDIEGRWDEEEKGRFAGIGAVLAAMMAHWRLVWIQHGTDTSGTHVTLESIAKKVAAEEKIPDDVRDEAIKLFFDRVPFAFKGGELKPPRDRIKRYWIEERLAFTRDWKRIAMREEDKKWWGTREQRERTHFRLVPDFAWLDGDGTLHVEDDKALWGKVKAKQVQSYGFGLAKLLEDLREPVGTIRCRFNRIDPRTIEEAGVFSPEDLADFPGWLDAVESRILADREFRPHVSKSCDWCGFMAECPAHQKVGTELQTTKPEQLQVPTTLEEAQKLGLWILVGEAVLAAAKKAARGYVEPNGAVQLPGTDKELRLNPAEVKEAAAGDILGALVQAGIDRGPILERIKLKPGDVEDVLKGVYPLAGKGVTKDVKEANRAARAAVEAALEGLWTTKPLAPTFGIFTAKEAA